MPGKARGTRVEVSCAAEMPRSERLRFEGRRAGGAIGVRRAFRRRSCKACSAPRALSDSPFIAPNTDDIRVKAALNC